MYLSEDVIEEFARRLSETLVAPVKGHQHVYKKLLTDQVAEGVVRLLLELLGKDLAGHI